MLTVFHHPKSLGAILLVASLMGCQSTGWMSQNSPPEDPSVIATFADQEVHMDEFEQQYARAVGGRTQARNDSLAAYKDYLERYINFRLKLLDANARGLANDPELQEAITSRPSELARRFLVSDTREKLLHELYRRSKTAVDISHILIKLSPTAPPEDTLKVYRRMQAIVDSLESGMSFAEAAARFSEGNSASRDSGRVGYRTAGRMYHTYENYVYNTPVGEHSPIFRGRFAYYIIKVHDRRPAYHERRISHLMINIPSNTRDTLRAYRTIQQFQDSIRAGKSFAEIARKYSHHGPTARRGGDFGWVLYNQMVEAAPNFIRAAFALDSVGAVSDIVRSRYGYHLIKLTAKPDYSSFETAYPQLKKRLSRLPRGQNLDEKTAQQIFRRYGKSVDSSVVNAALGRLPSDSAWTALKENGFDPAYENEVFASIGDSTYTLADLEPALTGYVQDTVTTMVWDKIDQFLQKQAFAYMVPILKQENETFARVLREYRNGLLLFKVSQATVWDVASRDTAALRSLYETHSDRYRWPKRHRIVLFRSEQDSTLENVTALLDKGLAPDEVEDHIQNNWQRVHVDTVLVSQSLSTAYGPAFELEPGEHTGVLQQKGVVYLLDGIEAPRQKTFEEAYTTVVRDYQKQLERQWIEELHARYNARLYPERLKHAFSVERRTSNVTRQTSSVE